MTHIVDGRTGSPNWLKSPTWADGSVQTRKGGVWGLRSLAAALALAACACASTGTAAEGTGGSGSDACWPVVPLELQALEHGREWEPIARLAADGSISNRRGPLGRIASDGARFSAGDTVWLQARCVGRSAELTSPINPALKMVVSYDASDAFNEQTGWGARITVADDGVVEMRTRGDRQVFGRPGGGGGAVRVVGDVRAARRTAALLVFATAAMGAGR